MITNCQTGRLTEARGAENLFKKPKNELSNEAEMLYRASGPFVEDLYISLPLSSSPQLLALAGIRLTSIGKTLDTET